MRNSPTVISPASMAWPPTTMITTPMMPITIGAEGGDAGDRGDRLGDVAEQPVDAGREHELFTLLRGVGLDDPDPADRLGQAAGDFGVDLAALAEHRTEVRKAYHIAAAESEQHHERDDASASSSDRTG